MSGKNRLLGIDLLRGIAIYAVIVLHSDEPLTASPYGWSIILEFSKFAVPFFLSASFYFAFTKFYTTRKPFQLQHRAMRLLVPYLIWSGIYIGYKGLKYWVDGDTDKLLTLLQDPVGIIFCGGAAFHLYFLPLLMTGTIIVSLIHLLPHREVNFYVLISLFIITLVSYQALLASGNEFNNAQGAAFLTLLNGVPDGSWVRLPMVFIAWSVRCLPYILLAMIGTHPVLQRQQLSFRRWQLPAAIALFITINLVGIYVLPAAVYELGRGYSGLILAIVLSQVLRESDWIQDLGLCSFGIYLSHLLFVESFYIVVNRIYPTFLSGASSLTLLVCAALILLVCWGLTNLLKQRKMTASFLLGT